MNPKLEDTITIDFITSSPTTGAAVDADSTPSCEVFEDADDTAILAPSVVKRTSKTGNYRITIPCTAANGFEAGKSYNAVVSATVATIAAKSVARTFQVYRDELADIAEAILKHDWTTVSGEATYSVLNALRMLRNSWNTADGTLSVHKEDGSSLAWQRTLTTDPTAEPITGAS